MSRKKINITETISELKQIIDKYGGIPSQQVDKAAYAKINYVIKRYADSKEVKKFLSEYSDVFMSDAMTKKGRRIDLRSKVDEFKQIIKKYGKIPSQYEDRKAYQKTEKDIYDYEGRSAVLSHKIRETPKVPEAHSRACHCHKGTESAAEIISCHILQIQKYNQSHRQ